MIIFEFDSLKPSIFKAAKQNFIVILLFVTCNVVQMLEWRQVMSIQYIKLNAEFL